MDKGGSEILYSANGGAFRTYVKYGTLGAGFRTAYGGTFLEGYLNFMFWNTVAYGLACCIMVYQEPVPSLVFWSLHSEHYMEIYMLINLNH